MNFKARLQAIANRRLKPFDIQVARGADLWRPLSQLGRQPERGEPGPPVTPAFLRVFNGADVARTTEPFDCAVVMPTLLRASITEAVGSVLRQDFSGTVQVLVGFDRVLGDLARLTAFLEAVPARFSVLLFHPGYSTSRRNGGLHAAYDGGALRTILSYLAHSRYVAYLDDDNWWAPDHLSSLCNALAAGDWAYSRRIFVHPVSRRPICEDRWELVGPGQGAFASIGGWVDPNCLAINKTKCEAVLPWWSIPLRNSPKAMDADRNVFRLLSTEFIGQDTHKATVFYTVDEADRQHAARLTAMGADTYAAAGKCEAREMA